MTHRDAIYSASPASATQVVSSVTRLCYLDGTMTSSPARLKVLLQERHWQTYRTFRREYDKAARSIDAGLVGTCPSRAQLGRWVSGGLKGLPYPDHCQVLEKMFPGWTADQLFEQFTDSNDDAAPLQSASNDSGPIVEIIEERLAEPENDDADWGPTIRAASHAVEPLALAADESTSPAQLLSRRLFELKQVRRMTDEEMRQLAGLSGCIVELNRTLDIHIDSDGAVDLSYHFDLLNLGAKPLTRISRELWFEQMPGKLAITAAPGSQRRVMIHRIHDTDNLAKFALQLSPPLQTGESASVGYSCSNGRFGKSHYWREEISRYTRRYTLRVRQENVQLESCLAVEEYPDGAEISANDSLMWDDQDAGITLTLTRDYLRPKQTVTLRWEIIHDSPG